MLCRKSATIIRSLFVFIAMGSLLAIGTASAQTVDLLTLPGPGSSVAQSTPQTYNLPGYNGTVTVAWEVLSDRNGQNATVFSRTFPALDNQTLPGSPATILPAGVRMLVFIPPYGQASNRANGNVTFTFSGGQPDLNRLQLLIDNLGTVLPTTLSPFQKTTITPSVGVTQFGTYNHSSTGPDGLTVIGGVIQNVATASPPGTNTGFGNFRLNSALPLVGGRPTLTLAVSQNFNDEISIGLAYRMGGGRPDVIDGTADAVDHVNLPHLVVPPDPCCPPWTEQTLQDSLAYFNTGSIASPYTLRWQPPSSLNAQMQAYINYLHAVDPAITNITIAFGVFQAGSGTAPVSGGAQVGGTGGTRLVTWTAGASAPTVPSNFFPAAIMQPGVWYTVGTTIFLNDGNSFFPETCDQNAISVRVQVVPGVRPSGGSTTRGTAAPMEVRLAPRSVGPAAPARRPSGGAR